MQSLERNSPRLQNVLNQKGPGGPGGHQMNINYQYALASKKANGILGCIRQSMVSRFTGVIPSLYSEPVKLHLENYVQF